MLNILPGVFSTKASSVLVLTTSTIVCLSMNFILKRFHHCKCVPVFVFNRKFGKINIGITILRQTNTRKKHCLAPINNHFAPNQYKYFNRIEANEKDILSFDKHWHNHIAPNQYQNIGGKY